MDPNRIQGDPFSSDEEDSRMMDKNWSKIDAGLRNAGVRDGFGSIQDSAVQDGFNLAFKEALQLAMSAGRLQGGISALLSCPLQAAKQPTTERANVPAMQHEAPLQHLLTCSTRIMEGIPSLLSSEVEKNSQSKLEQSAVLEAKKKNLAVATDSNGCCQGTLECSAAQTTKESQAVENQNMISCEDLCQDRSKFWSQLESFKEQARTHGVVLSHD